MHLGVFEEVAGSDALTEIRLAKEVVVDAITLAGTRSTGGGRHAEVQLGHLLT
jgi:hypothetical protein